MIAHLAYPLAAAILYSGAILITSRSDRPRLTLPATGRDLVRPLILPFLWRGLEAARRGGSQEEYVTRGRLLMRMIPQWADGHVLLASHLAFEASLAQRDPQSALDRLLAGLALLEEAQTLAPASRDYLLETMAQLLLIRCDQDPRLDRAFRQRFGRGPTDAAVDCLRRTERLNRSANLREQLFDSLVDGIPSEIRHNDRWRVRVPAQVASARKLIESLTAVERVVAWRPALQKLDSYLRGSPDTTLADLSDIPELAKIVTALRSR